MAAALGHCVELNLVLMYRYAQGGVGVVVQMRFLVFAKKIQEWQPEKVFTLP